MTVLSLPKKSEAAAATARFCPSCKSAETSVSYRNSDGASYCRCLTCACRFWGA